MAIPKSSSVFRLRPGNTCMYSDDPVIIKHVPTISQKEDPMHSNSNCLDIVRILLAVSKEQMHCQQPAGNSSHFPTAPAPEFPRDQNVAAIQPKGRYIPTSHGGGGIGGPPRSSLAIQKARMDPSIPHPVRLSLVTMQRALRSAPVLLLRRARQQSQALLLSSQCPWCKAGIPEATVPGDTLEPPSTARARQHSACPPNPTAPALLRTWLL